MGGPGDFACAQLKHCMVNHVMTNEARHGTMHHLKMAVGIVLNGDAEVGVKEGSGSGSDANMLADDSPNIVDSGRQNPLCAWLYAGSHNLSGAAWGKIEATEDEEVKRMHML